MSIQLRWIQSDSFFLAKNFRESSLESKKYVRIYGTYINFCYGPFPDNTNLFFVTSELLK